MLLPGWNPVGGFRIFWRTGYMIWGFGGKKELKAGACVLTRAMRVEVVPSFEMVLPKEKAEVGRSQSPLILE